MTSRERFETWAASMPQEFDLEIQDGMGPWPGQYEDYITQCAWCGWQAAEAAAVRRCADLCKGLWVTDDEIRAEFPEAWK